MKLMVKRMNGHYNPRVVNLVEVMVGVGLGVISNAEGVAVTALGEAI